MSYKKKEHGGERQPSTVQMKWLPCKVLTDHTECWWTRLTTRLLLGSRLWGTTFSSPENGKLTVCTVADCQALPQGSVSKNVISWPWWRQQPPGMGRKPRTQGHGGNKVLKWVKTPKSKSKTHASCCTRLPLTGGHQVWVHLEMVPAAVWYVDTVHNV